VVINLLQPEDFQLTEGTDKRDDYHPQPTRECGDCWTQSATWAM